MKTNCQCSDLIDLGYIITTVVNPKLYGFYILIFRNGSANARYLIILFWGQYRKYILDALLTQRWVSKCLISMYYYYPWVQISVSRFCFSYSTWFHCVYVLRRTGVSEKFFWEPWYSCPQCGKLKLGFYGLWNDMMYINQFAECETKRDYFSLIDVDVV
jgi:hypothetical protein